MKIVKSYCYLRLCCFLGLLIKYRRKNKQNKVLAIEAVFGTKSHKLETSHKSW